MHIKHQEQALKNRKKIVVEFMDLLQSHASDLQLQDCLDDTKFDIAFIHKAIFKIKERMERFEQATKNS